MKKNNFLIFLVFCGFFNPTFSQITNGTIEYGVKTSYDIKGNEMEQVKNFINNASALANKLILTLNFNKNESYFYVNPLLSSDGDLSSFEVLNIHKGIYCNSKDSKYRILKSSEVIGDYRMDYEKKSDWILSNDTKIIDGYLCFKATSYFYNENGWVDNPKFNITAWYTTKIPVPYGPNGYHGLPGLILEVQNGVSTLFIKNISLNLNKEPKINNLESLKNLTSQQALDSEFTSMPMLKKDIIEHGIIEKQKSDEIQKKIDERKALEKNK